MQITQELPHQLFLFGPGFALWGIVMLKQERTFPKVLTQSGKQNCSPVTVYCSRDLSLKEWFDIFFAKYAHLFSCRALDEKIDTTIMCTVSISLA